MKKHPVAFTLFCCAVTAAVAVSCCMLLFSYRFGGREGIRSALRFVQARDAIGECFVGDTDTETLTEGALSGMVEAIDDQWSYYMNAEDYAAYQIYSANQYYGVGITVRNDEDGTGLPIVSVTAGSPAEKAGIRADMRLTAVDGKPLLGANSADARAAILDSGGEVTLSLVTEDGVAFDAVVRLENLDVQVIYDEMLEGGIGYIRITNFEGGVAAETERALERLMDAGAEKFIFDVRGNPGGRLNELTRLLDDLLPEGEIFVSRLKTGEESVQTSDASCIRAPMAVLIDGNSYSAAEFFAAALSEYGWAVTVGAQTTGKSRSQVNIMLMDGDVLHLSTAQYLTPNRVNLTEEGGLTPDIPVEAAEEEDTQLAAAVEYLLDAKPLR